MAHEKEVLNEKEMILETKVPIKGAVGHRGAEADFTTIISTKKVPLTKVEPYKEDNKLLTLSEREEALGFKYVFQTYIDKDTVNEKMRSAMGLWDDKEKYIDNDLQFVIDRLHSYYDAA